ncbi:MAG: DUF4129 domain-containing protein [Pseudomonadota bacterium]
MLERLFARYSRKLARRGLQRRIGEGPRSLARRAARERPELAAQTRTIGELLEQGLYGDAEPDLRALRRHIRRL